MYFRVIFDHVFVNLKMNIKTLKKEELIILGDEFGLNTLVGAK